MREWFNENELRSYPIREDALQIAEDGTQLPEGILADLSIVVDADSSADLYISSISLTPTLISIAIAGTGDEGLLVGSYVNPQAHVPYTLSPLVERVSGFVVFGYRAIVEAPESYRFSGTSATALEQKTIRPFETPPVWSLSDLNNQESPELTDIIRIVEGDDVEIRRNGNKLVIGLKEAVRASYVGPCDRLIDYITCGRPPLREINGVGPDVDGKITIEVR